MSSLLFTKAKLVNQKGFSLLELMIAMSLLTIIYVMTLPESQERSVNRVADGMVDKINRVQRASRQFYRKHNAWPLNANTLVSDGVLTSGEELDSWGNAFVLSVVGQDLSVSSDVQEIHYVSRMVGQIPRSSFTDTTVTSLIDKPSADMSHDALYARDGSRSLTGPMDVNGQNINNANDITAKRFLDADNTGYYVEPASTTKLNAVDVNSLRIVANATIGGSCTTKSIGTTSDGTFAICESGIWKTSGDELPVGSIFLSTTTQNPSTMLGYGTWQAFGSGRVLVGQDNGDASFNSMEEIGGSKTHTLSVSEIPSHNHIETRTRVDHRVDDGKWWQYIPAQRLSDSVNSINTGGAGGGQPHNNLQPYIVVKMWKRIS